MELVPASTLLELRDTVAPLGAPETLRLTMPAVSTTKVEIALVPLVPGARLRLEGEALMVKSVAVMVTATDAECEVAPSVPVTVIV
jgi:hypothetical protein